VRRALGAVVRQLVALTGFEGRADYLAVLMPQTERGAESFRASFALNHDAPPSRANAGAWANLVAHEVLHYWNGWRLQGADYASTQWFQEGFTEYGANLALVSAGVVTPEQFHDKLATHVANYRRLATPLDAPGTRKGPPLYSGGALVAFVWDGMLREATRGQRGYADVLRGLLPRQGVRRYAWPDIQAALEGLAPGAWAQFHERHIHGTEPLPLEAAFARVGLRLSQDAAGAPVVRPDPDAPAAARQRGRALVRQPPMER
jgi:predicted metalloprotease with PDZ domain